jgi:hypothetical protein
MVLQSRIGKSEVNMTETENETTSKRFVLLLPPAQWEGLRSESERTGEPVSVILRRLIREHLQATEKPR